MGLRSYSAGLEEGTVMDLRRYSGGLEEFEVDLRNYSGGLQEFYSGGLEELLCWSCLLYTSPSPRD